MGYLPGSLTPIQKFGISPRVSYTHTEIRDTSPGLLHPHRNLGSLPESLTPTQKFRISPRVSYTHTKIQDSSPGLLHPHRNFGSLPVSLTPTEKFGISPRLSYTHTGPFGYYRGSPSPTQDLSDTTTGLLYPPRTFHLRELTAPFFLCPTHINFSLFPDSNYESSLDVVPKTNSTHTHLIRSTLTLPTREEHPHQVSLKASTSKPKSITQDATMNEYDASNLNATLFNKCKSRNVPYISGCSVCLAYSNMRPLPPRTISPHMPRLAAMVTRPLPSLTRTLGLQTLCLTPTYALALAYVTRLRSTRCWCGTLELILVPVTHTRGCRNKLCHLLSYL